MEWADLALERDKWQAVVDMVMQLCVVRNVGDFLTWLMNYSFTQRTLLHGVSYLVSFIIRWHLRI